MVGQRAGSLGLVSAEQFCLNAADASISVRHDNRSLKTPCFSHGLKKNRIVAECPLWLESTLFMMRVVYAIVTEREAQSTEQEEESILQLLQAPALSSIPGCGGRRTMQP